MCGTISYSGIQRAAPVVFQDLKRVECRVYDSAGIAGLFNRQLIIKNDTSTLNKIDARNNLSSPSGNLDTGHIRWATHGSVTPNSAHSQFDATKTIALPRNGTIENCQELCEQLANHGYRFISETDTQIIPLLIEDEVGCGCYLESAVPALVLKLEGSYAFLAVCCHGPSKIVNTKKDSPLVIGMGNKGYYAASDALAFSMKTNNLIPLVNTGGAVLKPDEVECLDAKGNELATPV